MQVSSHWVWLPYGPQHCMLLPASKPCACDPVQLLPHNLLITNLPTTYLLVYQYNHNENIFKCSKTRHTNIHIREQSLKSATIDSSRLTNGPSNNQPLTYVQNNWNCIHQNLHETLKEHPHNFNVHIKHHYFHLTINNFHCYQYPTNMISIKPQKNPCSNHTDMGICHGLLMAPNQ